LAADRPCARATAGLLRALRAAQVLCDRPEQATSLAALLAQRLDLPETATRAALAGGVGVERIAFAAAARPDPADGLWFAGEMRRWGWLASDADCAALVAQVYQPVNKAY
jgi:NitT/TauT family transport system ATP-binding protein/nitrate/nitrite transport system substrate-binding protein